MSERPPKRQFSALAVTAGVIALSTGLAPVALAEDASSTESNDQQATTVPVTLDTSASASDSAASAGAAGSTSATATKESSSSRSSATATKGASESKAGSASTSKSTTAAKSGATADSKSDDSRSKGKCPAGSKAVKDIRFYVNGKVVARGRGEISGIDAGDRVTVKFGLADGCEDVRLSFASYEADSKEWNRRSADQDLYDSDTGVFDANGTHSLTVKNAPCLFQIDFVRGGVLKHINKNSTYGNRKISWQLGGKPCKKENEGGGGGKGEEKGGGGGKGEEKGGGGGKGEEKGGGGGGKGEEKGGGGGAKPAERERGGAARPARQRVRVEQAKRRLPRTGAPSSSLAMAGFAATLVGGTLVVASYWRREDDAF